MGLYGNDIFSLALRYIASEPLGSAGQASATAVCLIEESLNPDNVVGKPLTDPMRRWENRCSAVPCKLYQLANGSVVEPRINAEGFPRDRVFLAFGYKVDYVHLATSERQVVAYGYFLEVVVVRGLRLVRF